MTDLIQANREAYVAFLRGRRLETAPIEGNVTTYNEKFRPVIAQLKARIAAGDFKNLPEYLGSGMNGSAFRIEVDGKAYAAKFSSSPAQANFELKPLRKAAGVPRTSQLAAYSFEDGVVVMDLLPGKSVKSIDPAVQYSDEHIAQLIETVISLDEKGLSIDSKPSNFLYDPEHGFSVLDYHLKEATSQGLPTNIMDLVNWTGALTARNFEVIDHKAPDYESRWQAQQIQRHKIRLPLLVRFLGILREQHPDILESWQRQQGEKKKIPSLVPVSELVERSAIPDHPDLQPHLAKLLEMGF